MSHWECAVDLRGPTGMSLQSLFHMPALELATETPAQHVDKLSDFADIEQEDANEELIEFMRGVLGTKHSDVTMLRGSSARHRRLLVSGLTPLQVYQKLQGAL